MEYIVSREDLFGNSHKMESYYWFNMWGTKRFPYSNLLPNDIIYWYDSIEQRIAWKTEVSIVDRYRYSDKQLIFDRYPESLTPKFKESRAEEGFFVGYKVKVIEKVDINKPMGFRVPRDGWCRVDDKTALLWFERSEIDDFNTLDDYVVEEKNSVAETLDKINREMQNVSPERIEKLILMTIRKDAKIVNALKLASGYRCQFPGCGQQILKKKGGFYIEVAHIKSVRLNGKSILGNLLVLCPNHHKEFDLGDLKIYEQYPAKIVGELNGKHFAIEITNHA